MSGVADYAEHSLPELLRVLQGSDVLDLEMREGDVSIRLHRSGSTFVPLEDGTSLPPLPAERGPTLLNVTSSLVGTFYRAAVPGAAPLVSDGMRVEEGATLGIIEALQLLTEVQSPARGVIVSSPAVDGQPVEYGQTLFELMLDD